MKKMNIIFLLTILIQIQSINGININNLQSEISCSEYVDDDQIIESFPFFVHINPAIQNSETTFAKMDKNENVVSMRIVNKKCVPSIVYCLKHLSELEVINTKFCDSKYSFIYGITTTHLPEQIGRLKLLTKLKLSNTGLVSLPDTIEYLLSLKSLILPDNNLTSLPMTITNLRSLQELTLNNNPYLRSVQPLNGHPSLKMLFTRHCSIELLPRNLSQLTTLYMSGNNLTKLTGIATLGNGTNSKKSFYFDKNYIRFISPQIQHVRNLYRLDLNDNKLDILPTNIFDITTLLYLNIRQNNFDSHYLKAVISKFRDTNSNLNILYN